MNGQASRTMTLQSVDNPSYRIEHIPTSTYSRLPSQPRISIACPLGLPTDQIATSTGPLILPNVSAWTYASRHTAQTILPGVLLGPTSYARNAANLTEAGITLAIGLCASDTPFAHASQRAIDRACATAGARSVALTAGSSAELIRAFDSVNELIMTNLSGNVLLHCETGNDRAACAAAAYLCFAREVEYGPAITYIQGCRFSAGFDEERRGLMQAYSDILVARRAVAGNGGGQKRGRDDEDDSMIENDGPRHEVQSPFADI